MAKIKIEVTKVAGESVSRCRVVEQTDRDIKFIAGNGIRLTSDQYPEWWPTASELFVQGEDQGRDDETFVVTDDELVLIQEAIDEYNEVQEQE